MDRHQEEQLDFIDWQQEQEEAKRKREISDLCQRANNEHGITNMDLIRFGAEINEYARPSDLPSLKEAIRLAIAAKA